MYRGIDKLVSDWDNVYNLTCKLIFWNDLLFSVNCLLKLKTKTIYNATSHDWD